MGARDAVAVSKREHLEPESHLVEQANMEIEVDETKEGQSNKECEVSVCRPL